MTSPSHKLAVVIPTIGRYDELRRMLRSLAAQTRPPDEVIITGEGEGNEQVAREFALLNARFINLPGSSICDARNAGIEAARPDADLIGFFDDDIVLEPQCLEALLKFWENGPRSCARTEPCRRFGGWRVFRPTTRSEICSSASGRVWWSSSTNRSRRGNWPGCQSARGVTVGPGLSACCRALSKFQKSGQKPRRRISTFPPRRRRAMSISLRRRKEKPRPRPNSS
jgi:glycosyltransferase involved in cell wall biosynthesis